MRKLAACRRLPPRNVLACGLTTKPGSGRPEPGYFYVEELIAKRKPVRERAAWCPAGGVAAD